MNEDRNTTIASTYPGERVAVMGFEYRTPLHLKRDIKAVQVRKGEDANYVLSRPYEAVAIIRRGGGEERFDIRVPANLLTDLSSVPRWGRWLVGRVGPHLEASIVHDWLYVAWQDERMEKPTEEMRSFADDVFRAAMKVAKVDGWRIWLIYQAVHLCGKKAFYGRDGTLFHGPAS
ncbi:MAG: DUF1353 domain-containing protein [Dehalococcoidia bacterium]|nr:DUF1353 domain-containing protein [Dehalococcoidia bacterium]